MPDKTLSLAELSRRYDSVHRVFKDIIIAVSIHGDVTLVGGPNVWEAEHFIGEVGVNEYFEPSYNDDEKEDRHGFPEQRGLYRCTIEYIFEQGYFEGWKCDSESTWDILCSDVEEITIPEKSPVDPKD